jgi:hypothetical protein
MVRKTRKAAQKKETGMTVPELRRAFERIDTFVARNGSNVEAFRKEWKKTFGKDVSANSAKEYLEFVSSKKSKKTKNNQTGGMAPLDYDLRAGADIPYGSFLPYVSKGFGFANMDSIAAVCGKEDITPVPPAGPSGLGSNEVKFGGGKKNRTRKSKKQRGGGVLNNVAELFQRPFLMNSPPTTLQHSQMDVKGYNGFPSPLPENPSFHYTSNQPVYGSYVSPTSKIV